jgi:hypothetical protein
MKQRASDITKGFPLPDINSSTFHNPDPISQTKYQEEPIIISKRSMEMIPLVDSKDLNLKSFSMVQLLAINLTIQSEKIINCPTFREQVVILASELHSDEIGAICTYSEIARMFNIKNVQTIRNQIISSKKNQHKDGRPSLITPDIGEFIVEVVTERFRESDPISIHELLDLILEDFGVGISLDTFRHYIRRNDFLHIIT